MDLYKDIIQAARKHGENIRHKIINRSDWTGREVELTVINERQFKMSHLPDVLFLMDEVVDGVWKVYGSEHEPGFEIVTVYELTGGYEAEGCGLQRWDADDRFVAAAQVICNTY